MAPRKPQPSSGDSKKKIRNKHKTPQARPAQQRILVIGPTGKRHLEW